MIEKVFPIVIWLVWVNICAGYAFDWLSDRRWYTDHIENKKFFTIPIYLFIIAIGWMPLTIWFACICIIALCILMPYEVLTDKKI